MQLHVLCLAAVLASSGLQKAISGYKIKVNRQMFTTTTQIDTQTVISHTAVQGPDCAGPPLEPDRRLMLFLVWTGRRKGGENFNGPLQETRPPS